MLGRTPSSHLQEIVPCTGMQTGAAGTTQHLILGWSWLWCNGIHTNNNRLYSINNIFNILWTYSETDQIVTEGKSVSWQHFGDVWLAALCLICKPWTPHVLTKANIRRTNITSVNNPSQLKKYPDLKSRTTLQTSSSPLVFSPRLGTLMVSSLLMAPRLISRMNWDSCGCIDVH